MIPQSPHYDQVMTYWKSLCTDERIPTVSMFDPIEVPAALPNITLWEMTEEDEIRCRLAGTAVVDRMGTDITGAELTDTTTPHARQIIITDFRTMISKNCGVWYAIINQHQTGKVVVVENLILPLYPEEGGLPKFVVVNAQRDVVAYEIDDAKLELARGFLERSYVDLGWGVPAIQDETSA